MENSGKFELVLKEAVKLPLVRINREEFLRRELEKVCTKQQVEEAINFNPAYAGISVETINDIADRCINYETNKVTSISFFTGLPGGFAALGTIPADIMQNLAHLLRIMQKLIYLYGWQEIIDLNEHLNDETQNMLILFIGVMYGVNEAVGVINRVATAAANKAAKDLAKKPLTKGVIYPIIKKVAIKLGLRMNKNIFSKGVAKAIPIIGGAASGTLTYITFKPCAKRLKEYLATLELCNVYHYDRCENIVYSD